MSKPDRQEFSTSSTCFTTLISITNKNERKFIFGSAEINLSQWIDTLTYYYHDLRMDTFIFWPIGNEEHQTRLFAEEVVPTLRSAIGQK